MRKIKLSQLEARMLRQNLVSSTEGYDYLNLVRLDHLAKKIEASLGEYGEAMAALALREKQIRRTIARAKSPVELEAANRALVDLTFEVEDLEEGAATVPVEIVVEDGDYDLIRDKIDSVERWNAFDAIRQTVIGMVEAVKKAEPVDDGESTEPRKLRRA